MPCLLPDRAARSALAGTVTVQKSFSLWINPTSTTTANRETGSPHSSPVGTTIAPFPFQRLVSSTAPLTKASASGSSRGRRTLTGAAERTAALLTPTGLPAPAMPQVSFAPCPRSPSWQAEAGSAGWGSGATRLMPLEELVAPQKNRGLWLLCGPPVVRPMLESWSSGKS